MIDQARSIGSAIKAAREKLASVSGTADLDARLLLSHAAEIPIDRLAFHLTDQFDTDASIAFEDLLNRRLSGEPVAYILGSQEFWSLPFRVTPDTLIPRPDSETLVSHILDNIDSNTPLRFLDLGTGTGALIISLLTECPNASAFAIDVSPAAADIARLNADMNGVADRLTVLQSDWFAALPVGGGGFDVILSNPPYIRSAVMPTLMRDVRNFEPHTALDGGADGLDAYRAIIQGSAKWLKPDGILAFEIGYDQADDVGVLLTAAGRTVQLRRDLAGNPRSLLSFSA